MWMNSPLIYRNVHTAEQHTQYLQSTPPCRRVAGLALKWLRLALKSGTFKMLAHRNPDIHALFRNHSAGWHSQGYKWAPRVKMYWYYGIENLRIWCQSDLFGPKLAIHGHITSIQVCNQLCASPDVMSISRLALHKCLTKEGSCSYDSTVKRMVLLIGLEIFAKLFFRIYID